MYLNLKNVFFNTEQSKAVAGFIGNRYSFVIQQGHEKQAEQCGYYESVGAGWTQLTFTACLGVMCSSGLQSLDLLCMRVWLWNHVVRINLNCNLPLPYIVKISPVTPTACYPLIPFPASYHHYHIAFYIDVHRKKFYVYYLYVYIDISR